MEEERDDLVHEISEERMCPRLRIRETTEEPTPMQVQEGLLTSSSLRPSRPDAVEQGLGPHAQEQHRWAEMAATVACCSLLPGDHEEQILRKTSKSTIAANVLRLIMSFTFGAVWILILTQTLNRKMTLGKLVSLSPSYLMQIVGKDKTTSWM
ncbi:uncharacterized protein LOC144295242 isoform X2 [Canis aureus]